MLGEIKRIELERAVHVDGRRARARLSDGPTLARARGAHARRRGTASSASTAARCSRSRRRSTAITKSNRDLLQRGHQAAREALASMGEIDIDAYDRARRRARPFARAAHRGRGDLTCRTSRGLRIALDVAVRAAARPRARRSQRREREHRGLLAPARRPRQTIGAPADARVLVAYDGDGGGVRVADVTRFRDQFLEIRAALEHGVECAISTAAAAAMDRHRAALRRAVATSASASSCPSSGPAWTTSRTTRATSAARTQLLERANTVAETFNDAATKLAQHAGRHDDRAGGDRRRDQRDCRRRSRSSTRRSRAQHDRRPARRTTSRTSATCSSTKLAELSGATVRDSDFGQIARRRSTAPRSCRTTSARRCCSTRRARPRSLRWVKDNFAADGHLRQGGRQARRDQHTMPGYLADLDTVATTLRDQVNDAARRDHAVRSPPRRQRPERGRQPAVRDRAQRRRVRDGHGRRRRLVGRRWRGRAADRDADRGQRGHRRGQRDGRR